MAAKSKEKKEKSVTPWLVLGGAVAAALVIGNKSQPVVPSSNTTVVLNPPDSNILTPSGGGPQIYDPYAVVSGVPGITLESRPLENWRRAHWATWYKELSAYTDQLTALQTIWTAWQTMSYADKIKDVKILWASLVTWRQVDNMGIGSFTFPITANASPVYDTWTNWWNGVTPWNCNDWETWFTAMENTWGLDAAKTKFMSAWSYADNWAVGSNAWGCSQTCDFINFFRQKGIDVADTGMATICNLIQVPYNLSTAAAGATQGISSTINTVANIAPLVVIGAGAALLYKQYKDATK